MKLPPIAFDDAPRPPAPPSRKAAEESRFARDLARDLAREQARDEPRGLREPNRPRAEPKDRSAKTPSGEKSHVRSRDEGGADEAAAAEPAEQENGAVEAPSPDTDAKPGASDPSGAAEDTVPGGGEPADALAATMPVAAQALPVPAGAEAEIVSLPAPGETAATTAPQTLAPTAPASAGPAATADLAAAPPASPLSGEDVSAGGAGIPIPAENADEAAKAAEPKAPAAEPALNIAALAKAAKDASAAAPGLPTDGDTAEAAPDPALSADTAPEAEGANAERPGQQPAKADASSDQGVRADAKPLHTPPTPNSAAAPDMAAAAAGDDASLPLAPTGQAAQAALRSPLQHAYPQPAAVPIEAVAVDVARMARQGMTRFEIRLDPPELGRVEVQIDVGRDGNTHTRLVVERAETLDMLMRDSRALERALQSAGLKTDEGGLQFSLSNGGTSFARDEAGAGRLYAAGAGAGGADGEAAQTIAAASVRAARLIRPLDLTI